MNAFTTILICIASLTAQLAHTQTTLTHPLLTVLETSAIRAEEGARPIAVFDLDDTLFDTRERSARILHELSARDDFKARYPVQSARLRSLTRSDIAYYLDDTLKSAGIQDPKVLAEIQAYWTPRFFSSSYCADDVAIPGAAAFVRRLVATGATIIYLTGRDEPRMGAGTLRALRKNGFPFGESARLVMKPHTEANEFEFKLEAFRQANQEGLVIAGFENEPRNINAMQDIFPGALMLFLNTQHSRSPEQPKAGIQWILDFLLP